MFVYDTISKMKTANPPMLTDSIRAAARACESQQDLAAASGLHVVTLSRFVCGREISLRNLDRLAAALGLSIFATAKKRAAKSSLRGRAAAQALHYTEGNHASH